MNIKGKSAYISYRMCDAISCMKIATRFVDGMGYQLCDKHFKVWEEEEQANAAKPAEANS